MSTADPAVGTAPANEWREGELTDALAAPPRARWRRVLQNDDLPTSTRLRMRRDAIYRRLLAVADGLALGFAVGVVALAFSDAPNAYALLALPFVVLLAKVFGLYDRDQHLIYKATLDELPKLFHLAVLVSFALLLSQGLLFEHQLSALAMLVLAVMPLRRHGDSSRVRPGYRARARAGRAMRRRRRSQGRRRDRREGANERRHRGVRRPRRRGTPRTASTDDLAAFLVRAEIQRVMFAPGAEHERNMLGLVAEIKSLGVKISVLPSVSQAGGTSFELDRIDGMTLLGVRGFEFNRSSQILKRSDGPCDLRRHADPARPADGAHRASRSSRRLAGAGSSTARLASGAMVSRSDAQVPHDAPRTPTRCATSSAPQRGGRRALQDRRRPAGHARRAGSCGPLSLDELPQLWNVLRGEMSLVGPRPLVVEEDRLIHGWHRQRLSLTPGMTGYWQVLGSAPDPARRDGQARLLIRAELVGLARHPASAADDPVRRPPARSVATPSVILANPLPFR